MMPPHPWRWTFGFAAVALLSSSCGSGGDGGPSAPASADFLLTDAPADDLLAFHATIEGMHLVRASGESSANLLQAPVTVELLGLEDTFGWLASRDVPTGKYESVRLVFTPGSYVATDESGADVPVTSSGDELVLAFDAPVTIGQGGYARFELDVELDDALLGDVDSPPIVFSPAGSVNVGGSDDTVGIDEFMGLVAYAKPQNATFTVQAYADGDMQVEVGQVLIRYDDETVFVDETGVTFAALASFEAALVDDATVVEVHGELVEPGTVYAQRVEIHDQLGGAGIANTVEIRGLVTGVFQDDPGEGTFELLVGEIEKGAALAEPLIDGDATIEVLFDGTTVFVEELDTVNFTALAVGQEVEVRFDHFLADPYPAVEVELERPEYEGVIVDTSGLPDQVVVHLDENDPAVVSDLVADDETDVIVLLDGAGLTLDTDGGPGLVALDLVEGLELEIEGGFVLTEGSAPTLSATAVEVRAGRLEGEVMSISPGTSSLTVDAIDIQDPFGDDVSEGAVQVILSPGVSFEHPTPDESSFFSLFDELAADEAVTIELRGIGTGTANEIFVYEVSVEVTPVDPPELED